MSSEPNLATLWISQNQPAPKKQMWIQALISERHTCQDGASLASQVPMLAVCDCRLVGRKMPGFHFYFQLQMLDYTSDTSYRICTQLGNGLLFENIEWWTQNLGVNWHNRAREKCVITAGGMLVTQCVLASKVRRVLCINLTWLFLLSHLVATTPWWGSPVRLTYLVPPLLVLFTNPQWAKL